MAVRLLDTRAEDQKRLAAVRPVMVVEGPTEPATWEHLLSDMIDELCDADPSKGVYMSS